MIELKLDYSLVKNILINFIKTEVNRIGMTKGIVGLSGGIDSAVSAFLTAEALGAENTYCIKMPYIQSSKTSIKHADLVIEKLRCKGETVDISPMVQPLFDINPDMDKVRKGNIMARERMIVLYDFSQKLNGLVIGTGNKTEILLGYTTVFGDSASAINPIGDLYKTQIWQFAEFLGIPEQIINKPPSADLWNGQTDEGELGFTYREADEILFLLVEERKTVDDLLELGFKIDMITRIKNLIQRNQYKRRMPLIAKITYRTVNLDFRYSRDWGT
jgi:NAD+ synthase